MPVTVFLNTSTLIGAETHILDRVIVLPRTSNLPDGICHGHIVQIGHLYMSAIILHICQPMRTAEAVRGTESTLTRFPLHTSYAWDREPRCSLLYTTIRS